MGKELKAKEFESHRYIKDGHGNQLCLYRYVSPEGFTFACKAPTLLECMVKRDNYIFEMRKKQNEQKKKAVI